MEKQFIDVPTCLIDGMCEFKSSSTWRLYYAFFISYIRYDEVKFKTYKEISDKFLGSNSKATIKKKLKELQAMKLINYKLTNNNKLDIKIDFDGFLKRFKKYDIPQEEVKNEYK